GRQADRRKPAAAASRGRTASGAACAAGPVRRLVLIAASALLRANSSAYRAALATYPLFDLAQGPAHRHARSESGHERHEDHNAGNAQITLTVEDKLAGEKGRFIAARDP